MNKNVFQELTDISIQRLQVLECRSVGTLLSLRALCEKLGPEAVVGV